MKTRVEIAGGRTYFLDLDPLPCAGEVVEVEGIPYQIDARYYQIQGGQWCAVLKLRRQRD